MAALHPEQDISPAPAPASDPVTERVLEIVSEKTGYPQDMLELDLDLEADLGIDTVKQAETILAIREAFDIPRRDDLKLRDYPTLAHVIRFVKEMRPDLETNKSEGEVEPQPSPSMAALHPEQDISPAPNPASDPVTERVLEIVSEKTGYPQDMLELDLDLEADLGIDTVKQAETILAIREAFDIPRRDDLKLRDYPTLAHVIQFVKEMKPDLETKKREEERTEGEIQPVAAQPSPTDVRPHSHTIEERQPGAAPRAGAGPTTADRAV